MRPGYILVPRRACMPCHVLHSRIRRPHARGCAAWCSQLRCCVASSLCAAGDCQGGDINWQSVPAGWTMPCVVPTPRRLSLAACTRRNCNGSKSLSRLSLGLEPRRRQKGPGLAPARLVPLAHPPRHMCQAFRGGCLFSFAVAPHLTPPGVAVMLFRVATPIPAPKLVGGLNSGGFSFNCLASMSSSLPPLQPDEQRRRGAPRGARPGDHCRHIGPLPSTKILRCPEHGIPPDTPSSVLSFCRGHVRILLV